MVVVVVEVDGAGAGREWDVSGGGSCRSTGVVMTVAAAFAGAAGCAGGDGATG